MINNYKIVKELNKGYSGVAYLVEKDNKQYVIKRQKLLPKEIKPNYKYSIWREIDFNKFVNKLSKSNQKYFMKMYDYKINNCDYQHKPKYIDPSIKKDLIARNKSKHCLDIVIEYKGNTIENKVKNGSIPMRERYCLIIQLLYALQLIREHKYMHQDIHQGNITYKKIQTPIKIYGKTLPCKYQYSLIDYGLVRHPKYNITKKAQKEFKQLFKSNNDIYEIMYQIVMQQYMLYWAYFDHNWKLPVFNKEETEKRFLKFYNEKQIWNKIRTVLVDEEDWFVYFDKHHIPKPNNLVGEKVEYLFSAFNRKKYLEIMGWSRIYIPNFIPSKDVIFMVQNITDNKKMIKYFLNKL